MKSLKNFILLCTMLIINMIFVALDFAQGEFNSINLIVSIILLIVIIISIEQSPDGIPMDINLTINENNLEDELHNIEEE